MERRSLVPEAQPVHRVDARSSEAERQSQGVLATADHAVIRDWAERHQAQPATGEATESGPATVDVHDGGSGIRFNFPAAALFRPISWDEWFQNFTRHDLVFVYENEERGKSSPRYRLVTREQLDRSCT